MVPALTVADGGPIDVNVKVPACDTLKLYTKVPPSKICPVSVPARTGTFSSWYWRLVPPPALFCVSCETYWWEYQMSRLASPLASCWSDRASSPGNPGWVAPRVAPLLDEYRK